jgi:transposase
VNPCRLAFFSKQEVLVFGLFSGIPVAVQSRRPLMAFVMVLSYSRAIYLRFFLAARMENFLRGHAGCWR